jgi:hypothetical protein
LAEMYKKIVVATSVILLCITIITFAPNMIVKATTHWNLQTIDSNNWGTDSCLVLDTAGNPHISFSKNQELMYASLIGSAWDKQSVAKIGDLSSTFSSLALDSSGKPHISYFYEKGFSSGGNVIFTTELMYANWNGVQWNIQNVTQVDRIQRCSLKLDSVGNPLICYDTNSGLKLTSWNGVGWITQQVGDFGGGASLALDSEGNPHICYDNDGGLVYATWIGSMWQMQNVGSQGSGVAFVLDSNNMPHFSFLGIGNGFAMSNSLNYAAWTGSTWSIQIVDQSQHGCWYPSIALDPIGNPHISYYYAYYDQYRDFKCDLRYAGWNNSAWVIQTVAKSGNYPVDCSLTMDSFGNPYISYFDFDSSALKYAYTSAYPSLNQTNNTSTNNVYFTIAGFIMASVAIIAVATVIIIRGKKLRKQSTSP